MIELVCSEEEAGERVDAFVARRSGLPRAAVQRALKAGTLTVGGIPARPSRRLEPGDTVAGEVASGTAGPPGAEDIAVDVVYSDDRVLVVAKPAGLVTHPGHGNPGGTLVNALLGLGGPLAGAGGDRPGLVHRLDKDTSGLLLVARDDDALAFLQEALKRRHVERGYLALVRGSPASPRGTVDAPIARHPRRRTMMAVVGDGRAAVTHYRVLDRAEGCALLDVALDTGRTHQIRVHLAHIGHPVLGDRTYGGGGEVASRLGLARPFLHAYRLAFPHPDESRRIELTSPLPPDLAVVLETLALTTP